MRERRGQQSGNVGVNTSRKRIVIMGVILAGAALVAASATLFFSGGLGIGQGTRFTKYLNEKYGQEFVVENVRETGVGLGGKGAWVADAYPKSDLSLKFEIRRSQSTGEITMDKFLETLWTKQGSSDVEDFLAKELPESESYYLTISPGSPGSALYDFVQGSTLSLNEALKNHKDKLTYSLSVRSAISMDSVISEPSEAQLNNALKVVAFVRSKNIPLAAAFYNYREKYFDKRDEIGQQEYQYGIRVEEGVLQNINTASDLKKYFKVLEK